MQYLLDLFYYSRRFIVNLVAYVSLRLYGLEISWKEVEHGTYDAEKFDNLNLDSAGDLDLLLSESRGAFDNAEARRSVVVEKTKVLLTLSSFLLALTGALAPKTFSSAGFWMRSAMLMATVALLNTIILITTLFDVRSTMVVSITQPEAALDSDNLKKSLINSYRQCAHATNNASHYLVDIYKASRFFFLISLTLVTSVVIAGLARPQPSPASENPNKKWQFTESLRF